MPPMRCLCVIAAAGLTASTAWAGPWVLLFPAVGTSSEVVVSGRVLQSRPGRGSSAVSHNLRWLASRNLPGADVEVRFQGRGAQTTSGDDGNFEVTLRPADGQRFTTGLSSAEARSGSGEVSTATVDVIADAAPFFVVSDFDDTLAVSNISEGGALKAGLLRQADSHPPVEGMADFYRCLRAVAPARPTFALVSGSPAQFAPRIQRFLALHGFPDFGLYLRDLGPSTLSGYKEPVLKRLLEVLPRPVVLVGDSGEKDPEVYAAVRAAAPERVKAIYIRDAGGDVTPQRFDGMVRFGHPREAAWDAASKGLADAACVRAAFPRPVVDGGAP